MKSEKLIYLLWTRYFLIHGLFLNCLTNIFILFKSVSGLNLYFKMKVWNRLELIATKKSISIGINVLTKVEQFVVNRLLFNYSSINHSYKLILKLHAVRLFLIKNYRGKAQFLGKPSKGQRTWSNAKTAKLLRNKNFS